MRLIDADAAVRLLKSIGSRDYRREKGTIADAMKMLSHPAYTPTIEAEPVKHGRWVKHYVDGTNMNGKPTKILFACNCSQCELDGEYPTNYCPNCGAKMNREVEEKT